MIRAYRMLVREGAVPAPSRGDRGRARRRAAPIKSAIGIGSLLMDGIGDTIRVSLTADPVKEIEVAWDILKSLGLRERGPVMIACPSCGRDNVGVEQLAEAVGDRLKAYPEAFEVAVMGCAVNGPGEAGDADFGIAGRPRRRLHLRPRARAEEGLLRHPDRRALPRDRPLDRRGHAAAEAAQARQARGGADGRGGTAAGRRAGTRDCNRVAGLVARASQLFIPTLREDPGRGRGSQPPAAAARRLHPPGRRPGSTASCLSAGECTRRPFRSSARRWTRSARRRCSCPVLTPAELWETTGRYEIPEVFKLEDRAGRRFVLPMTHEETLHLPREGDPELPGAAADALSLRDEGPGRAAFAGRAAARSRVHHEGLLLASTATRRASTAASGSTRRRVPPRLRALRDRVPCGPGRVGDDGRQRVRSTTSRPRGPARTRS